VEAAEAEEDMGVSTEWRPARRRGQNEAGAARARERGNRKGGGHNMRRAPGKAEAEERLS
jgi:hypothetical protein